MLRLLAVLGPSATDQKQIEGALFQFNLESAGNAIICKENASPQLRKMFSEMANVSKSDGALIIAQLSHLNKTIKAGRQTPIAVNEHPYSCSDIPKEIPATKGFVIGVKINSVELQKDGLTVEESAHRSGFDFVELSGGTFSRPALFHERETTRKREAYFIEFAEKIRPVFKHTVLYLTGGFRTAAAMVDAIKCGATDGIGLGRPTTAEPGTTMKI
ncbi:hypothetical protein ANCDUO_13372 [Ancylostoma duodenale]|uniref:NADH:flavin oxidoreductase/NADH oxidase N-terminal domain-containing protein n=1 Tax=Ancylostoma duodenale TaxID=51022 RepID=A0A0C2CJ53_9BILA|nr:hypothetical protein ANCDUO_13372 [Ancylostoma duodenale]